ncbi:MAG: nucleotide sugar dehydrogenase [Rhodospirillales bacterium]
MVKTVEKLLLAFENNTAKIGVVGLGYVGLPLVTTFFDAGFYTLGFDIDEKKVRKLLRGESYISHIHADRLNKAIVEGTFHPTADFCRVKEVDAVIICVPTPLKNGNQPDLSYIESTGKLIAPYLRKGQLIVLESTTYPGTTSEILKPILENSGLESGKDIFIAYSPEREDPGNPDFSTKSIPKIIGGDGSIAVKLASTMYNQIVIKTIPVSSLEIAEAVKLTENIFRSVNIAMVNELKTIFNEMGLDIWEIISAAKSKPFGYMPFYPGPGLGGHCIPIDPFYLTYRARQFGQETKFIKLAGDINTNMPNYVVNILKKALLDRFKLEIDCASILLIGMAYKKNVDDTRESPAYKLIELLESEGATVEYFDPFVDTIPKTREYSQFNGRKSIIWSKQNICEFDAALICTDHDKIDYKALVSYSKLVVDTRNVISSNNKSNKVIIA